MQQVPLMSKQDPITKQVFEMGKNLRAQVCKYASDVTIGDDHGFYVGEWRELDGGLTPYGVGVFVTD